jgi:hypothetical protein
MPKTTKTDKTIKSFTCRYTAVRCRPQVAQQDLSDFSVTCNFSLFFPVPKADAAPRDRQTSKNVLTEYRDSATLPPRLSVVR